ncbi:MoxR family ATPase [Sorangium sp. So ce134]
MSELDTSTGTQVEGKWPIFRGTGEPHREALPDPPPWRTFAGAPAVDRELPKAALRARFDIEPREIEIVNAALYLRRPLLVTGKPGTGKSTLARAVAHELDLGPVLVWPINTRSTLQEGLYRYDAIGRAQDAAKPEDIGKYMTLGPLGTALLPSTRPRVLLIDEIDKSDIDLPNDLLNVFEEGTFEIPELSRLEKEEIAVRAHDAGASGRPDLVTIRHGRVTCSAFPFVVLTSNDERDFPAPFLRRCIRLEMLPPDEKKLARIVAAHFNEERAKAAEALIADFLRRRTKGDLATDQLLNAVYMATLHDKTPDGLQDAILRALK